MNRFILCILTLVIISFHAQAEEISNKDKYDLYSSYINMSCPDSKCVIKKGKTYNLCKDDICKNNLIKSEEIILQTCENSISKEKKNCFIKQNSHSILHMCSTSSCQKKSISELIKKLMSKQRISFKKVGSLSEDLRDKTLRALKKIPVVVEISSKTNELKKNMPIEITNKAKGLDIVANSNEEEFSKKIRIDELKFEKNDNTQFEAGHKTKEIYLNQCEDQKCKDKVNETFSYLPEKKQLSEEEIKIKLDSVSEEFSGSDTFNAIKKIYIKHGPYSNEMISYFKAHEEIGKTKFTLPKGLKNCKKTLIPDICEKSKDIINPIKRISTYFYYNNEKNDPFKFANKLYKENVDINNVSICYLTTDVKLPEVDGKYDRTHGREFNLAYSFAKTQKECKEKIKNTHLLKLKEKLKELGNFAISYQIITDDIHDKYPWLSKSYNIKGSCDAYLYTPLYTHKAPTKKELDKSKRVRVKLNYKEATLKECHYQASKNYFLSDPSKTEEYIFFNGDVPIVRAPSKRIMEKWESFSFQFNYSYIRSMSTSCLVKAKRFSYKPHHNETDDKGSCKSICKKRIETILSHSKKYNDEYVGLGCYRQLEYKQNNFKRKHDYDVYKSPNDPRDKDKKLCQHFDYSWSKHPSHEFYARSVKECFDTGFTIQGSTATDKQSYLDLNYISKHAMFRDIEIKFNNKSILKYKNVANLICSAEYRHSTKGYLKREKGKLVSTKKECFDLCNSFHKKVSSMARKSITWVHCNLRTKSNNKSNLLNFLMTPKDTDPLIVVSPDDPISKEKVLYNYFNKLKSDP